MLTDDIRGLLFSFPEVAGWPRLRELIERPVETKALPCWEYTVLACRAVGGDGERAVPGAAAIFCTMYSIHLVDDLLDRDPEGLHHRIGEGEVANIALAFQALGAKLIDAVALPSGEKATIQSLLAGTALATAYGQHLDLEDPDSEEAYWETVNAKAPPLFGAALCLGAILGEAAPETVDALREAGELLGKCTQVSDDLKDALERPASPDWRRRGNNLAIFYGLFADHPQREELSSLLPRIDEPEALEAAQRILVRSGAVSYCVYQMIELRRAIKARLDGIELRQREPIDELLEFHTAPIRSLFESIGVEATEELLD